MEAPDDSDHRRQRLQAVVVTLPLLAMLAAVLLLGGRADNDGIIGVLLGVYGVLYFGLVLPRIDTADAGAIKRFIQRHRVAGICLGLLILVGGLLDMAGVL